MHCSVFRPKRIVDGKRVQARLFSGRYSLARGEKPVTVALHTPDRMVAQKKLRDIIVEKQREMVGLIAPKALREAASTPLLQLVTEYRVYLVGCGRSPDYVRDTIKRIERIIHEAGWTYLADVRPDSFLNWRSKLAA